MTQEIINDVKPDSVVNAKYFKKRKFKRSNLSKLIKAKMKKEKLTATDAAKQSKVPRQTLNDCIAGRVTNIDIIVRIANWLEIAMAELFSR